MSEAVLKPHRTEAPAAPASVILVGNPNVGKSALFGALTGRYVTVSNYPGTTVEMTRGHLDLAGARVTVIDTPGTNSLSPSSEDERVTRDVLLRSPGAAIIVVGDAKNVERTILLALQLGAAAWSLVLLVLGTRVVHGWDWLRTLGSVAAAAALLAAIVGVFALV